MTDRTKMGLIAGLVLMIAAGAALAQDEETDWTYEDGYAYGGATVSLWMPELEGLNDALDIAGYEPVARGTWLGGQTVAFGARDGMRAGFSMVNGFSTCCSQTERKAMLATTMYTGLLEVPVAQEAEGDILLGVALGGAHSTLSLVDHAPDSFEDALGVPFRSELTHWSYIIEPALIATHTPIRGFDLRLRLGLIFALGNRWTAETETFDVPLNAFSGPRVALSIQLNMEELIQGLADAEFFDEPEMERPSEEPVVESATEPAEVEEAEPAAETNDETPVEP